MEKALTVAQMKKAEQYAVEMGSSYLELMENAGTGCSRQILKLYSVINRSCVILCGNGNNGGDGFVIARKLHERGADVTVVLCNGMPATLESSTMYEKLKGMEIRVLTDLQGIAISLQKADLVIDTVFGTGFHGKITGMTEGIIAAANGSRGIRIAVDLPSGMNGDSGMVEGIFFRADTTLALGAYKQAHLLEKSAEKCGRICLVEIGIPESAYEKASICGEAVKRTWVRRLVPTRKEESNKGDYGKLLILAGSVGMGGAALMCTQAAMRCGVGLTTLATAKTVVQNGFLQIMEAVTLPMEETEQGRISVKNLPWLKERMERSTAVVVGCGLGNCAETEQIVTELLQVSKVPLILDADGINVLAVHNHIEKLKEAGCPVILTPHPGEMARLTGLSVSEIQSSREQVAYEFAKKYGVILVLKGHKTITALPDGTLYENTTGNAGMAKGGSGDVLAGMIGGLAAQGMAPEKAAVLGVYLHGLAGDLCAEKYTQYGMIARDLIAEIPRAWKELMKEETLHFPAF